MPCKLGWILTTSALLLILVRLTHADRMRQDNDTSEDANIDNDININLFGSKITTNSGPSPVFASQETVVRVPPSHMAIIPCSVRFLGDRQVVWRKVKDDEFLTIGKMVWTKDPRILVEHRIKENGVTTWDLLLRNVQYDDAGVYECQVTSSEKIVWLVELKVIDPVTTKPKSRVHKQVTQAPHVTEKMRLAASDRQRPAQRSKTGSGVDDSKFYIPDRQKTPPKDEFFTAGQLIRLVCNASIANQTFPKTSEAVWYKNGEAIESNKNVLLTRYHLEADQLYVTELIIDRSMLADSGEYLCRIKNIDVLLVQVYVLPNTTINSVNSEDQSQLYAVDSLQKESRAVSLYRLRCNWNVAVLYLINALLVIYHLPMLTCNVFHSIISFTDLT